MKVSKKEFVAIVAEMATERSIEKGGNRITMKITEEILDAISDATIQIVKNGNEVKVGDLGVFYSTISKARQIKLPNGGETVTTEEKTVPKLRISSTFKEMVVGGDC